jgi:hypothetical protein
MADWTFTPSEGPSSGTPFTLKVLADGVPRRTGPVMTQTKVPGGAVTIIDRAGPALKQIDLSVLFLTGADALAAEDLEGYQGTLDGPVVDLGGSLGHAPALFNTIQRMSRGVTTQGPVVLSVNFIILGASS